MLKSSKTLFFLIFLVLLTPLASATFTVDLDDTYATGETVTISGTCDDDSQVAFQLVTGASRVWIDQVTTDSSDEFSVDITPDDGEYTLYSYCAASEENDFCVGDDCETTTTTDDDTSADGGATGSGSSDCDEDWLCYGWSYCNSTLEQSRICSDQNSCGTTTYKPNITQSCDECDESWVCSSWSDCSSDINRRTCVEEHDCGTTDTKPDLTKSCEEEDASGYAPAAIEPTLTVPAVTTEEVEDEPVVIQESIWDKYAALIIGIPIVLIVIIALIITFLKMRSKEEPAENLNQLETYAREELKAGLSKGEVRSKLEESGWDDEEISEVLSKLDEKDLQQQPPAQ